MFAPLRTVSNRILRDPITNMSRGVGFARMIDRAAAVAIIEKFNGHILEGTSVPLQVRFADSPAQKQFKNQTTRKKPTTAIRPPPREYQPMFPASPPAFPAPMMMPITPETMLGIAPAPKPTATVSDAKPDLK